MNCDAGNYCAGGDADPEACAEGTQDPDDRADTECVACDAGTYCAGGDANPEACAAGTQDHDDRADTECVACDAGTYCAGGAADPEACAAGTRDDDGSAASACADCAAGNYCAGGDAALVVCENGLVDADNNSATPCVRTYRVFITDTNLPADFGGVLGGDALCQTEAEDEGLGGTWRAWLSNGNVDAIDRIAGGALYQDLDGGQVSNPTMAASPERIRRPINLSPTGNTNLGSVWTGTDVAGGAGPGHLNCNNWSTRAGTGRTGFSEDTRANWTAIRETACNQFGYLYCFEVAADQSSCGDGIENGNETGLDCGGDCEACCEAGFWDDDGDRGTDCVACAAGTYCPGGQALPEACGPGTVDADNDASTECVAYNANCGAGDSRCMFVTTATYPGNFVAQGEDALDTADELCQQHAEAANPPLPGSYRAWLSVDGGDSPSTRFEMPAPLPYLLPDGARVADDWTHLIDGTARVFVDKTEDANNVGGGFWSFTASEGTPTANPGEDCDGWTSAAPGALGWMGITNRLGAWSLDGPQVACDGPQRHLVCVQQSEAAGDCPAGQWDDDGNPANACAFCQPGNYCGGAHAPIACPAGTWDDDNSAATPCLFCEIGNFCAGGDAAEVACEDGGIDHDDDASTPCQQTLRVFTTAEAHTGDLGGVGGADTICAEAATAAGIDSHWRAWLSTGRVSARDRLPGDAIYTRSDRVTPVTSPTLADSLQQGGLANNINQGPDGAGIGEPHVWTASRTNGTLNVNHCDGWTSGDAGDTGDYGWAAFKNGNWTQRRTDPCNLEKRLYCFEVPADFSSCEDGVENGEETGLDCGGACGDCCEAGFWDDDDNRGTGCAECAIGEFCPGGQALPIVCADIGGADGDNDPSTPCSQPNQNCGDDSRCIFVSSTTYTGAFGQPGDTGLLEADAACQAQAQAANPPLRGTYRAWLSVDGGGSPSTRFVLPQNLPYVMPEGTRVADDYATLTSVDLQAFLDKDENGNASPAANFWSNTARDGTPMDAGQDCNRWTTAAGVGWTGRSNQLAAWSANGPPFACNSPQRALLCVQQAPGQLPGEMDLGALGSVGTVAVTTVPENPITAIDLSNDFGNVLDWVVFHGAGDAVALAGADILTGAHARYDDFLNSSGRFDAVVAGNPPAGNVLGGAVVPPDLDWVGGAAPNATNDDDVSIGLRYMTTQNNIEVDLVDVTMVLDAGSYDLVLLSSYRRAASTTFVDLEDDGLYQQVVITEQDANPVNVVGISGGTNPNASYIYTFPITVPEATTAHFRLHARGGNANGHAAIYAVGLYEAQ